MAEPVTHLEPRRVIPAEVTLTREDMTNPRFTPRELRMIKEGIGRSLTEAVSDDTSDDRLVIFAWTKLRRDGFELSWEDLDDIVIRVQVDAPDPTNASPSTTSQPSASTGA